MSEESIDVLRPAAYNPRDMKAEAADGLGVSMEAFGDISGIVWNERSGNLVAGHQRMAQLRAAGAKRWRRNGAGGEVVHPKTRERFLVRIVDWDETTERVANLAANNPEIQGAFSAEALAQLKALDEHAAFDGLRLDALLETLEEEMKGAGEPAGGNTDPDEVPEPPKVPVTKPGDLWILGEHRLLCGDSTKVEDVARVMGGQRAALCCTDPPYGVNFQDNEGKNLAADISYAVIPAFFGLAVDAVGPGRALLFFGAETNIGLYGALFGRELRMRPRLLFWRKPSFVLRHHDYHSQYECIFYGWTPGGDAATRWHGDRKQSDVWEVSHDDESRGGSAKRLHPTQKPVELFHIPMANHTKKGEVCFEPFSGSGSQMIAGEQFGRQVFGLELDPRFVDVAVTRWENFTGRKAERQPAGKPARADRPGKKPRRK